MEKLRMPLLVAIIATSCCAPAAQAACKQWDVGGVWHAYQNNQPDGVYFDIHQDGGKLRGKATYTTGIGNGKRRITGKLSGILSGNKLEVRVRWASNSRGVYKGKIDSQGQLKGITYDEANLGSNSYFNYPYGFKCMDAAIEEPSGPPPLELGKVPIPEVVLDDPLDICGYARSARKRGSPAAPGLERQCREAGGEP